MTATNETARCRWTGREFAAVKRGPHAKKFASPAAKSEAHTAARMYTERLIEGGYLTWEGLRAWFDAQKSASTSSCTTQQMPSAPASATTPAPRASGHG